MPDLEFSIARSGELKDKLRENLARIFEFSPADLAQNQAGKFGDGQMRRLSPKVFTPLYRTAAAAVCYFTFIWLLDNSTWFASFFQDMEYMRNGIYRNFTHATPLSVTIGLLFAVAPWVISSSPGTSLFLLVDLIFGAAAKAEGKVWLSQTTGLNAGAGAGAGDANSSETNYQYAIGDLKFDVPYNAVAALDENALYRVYYAPRSNILLSIEPI